MRKESYYSMHILFGALGTLTVLVIYHAHQRLGTYIAIFIAAAIGFFIGDVVVALVLDALCSVIPSNPVHIAILSSHSISGLFGGIIIGIATVKFKLAPPN